MLKTRYSHFWRVVVVNVEQLFLKIDSVPDPKGGFSNYSALVTMHVLCNYVVPLQLVCIYLVMSIH